MTDDGASPSSGSLGGIRVDLLASFACLAEELHFTRAAQHLHVSQPGLTRRVAQLERCLGVSLLDRSSRAVQLTAAGRAMLPFARAIVEQAALAGSAVRDAAERPPALAPSQRRPNDRVLVAPVAR